MSPLASPVYGEDVTGRSKDLKRRLGGALVRDLSEIVNCKEASTFIAIDDPIRERRSRTGFMADLFHLISKRDQWLRDPAGSVRFEFRAYRRSSRRCPSLREGAHFARLLAPARFGAAGDATPLDGPPAQSWGYLCLDSPVGSGSAPTSIVHEDRRACPTNRSGYNPGPWTEPDHAAASSFIAAHRRIELCSPLVSGCGSPKRD